MREQYADIIVDISHEKVDRTFQYRIPNELVGHIGIGDRVQIPFGRGNKQIGGFVLGLSDQAEIEPEKIKSIMGIANDNSLVESKLITLADWMRRTYGSTMNMALKTVLPIRKQMKKVEQKTAILLLDEIAAQDRLETFIRKHQVARARFMEELIRERTLDIKVVTSKLNIPSATIRFFETEGIIEISSRREYRDPKSVNGEYEKKILNDSQQAIVNDFAQDYDKGNYGTYLIHGVTGSGKTEVYMEMIEHVIATGRQAIVLIPEISLTYQTWMRFLKRFPGRVSTLHSKLSDGERYDQFEKAKNHETDIMIGPRSALFVPFDNIGIIIIDEEHEHTYKSESMPKYHAREVAQELAKLHNASVVLGSATPSLESYYAAKNGQYKLYKLEKRAVAHVMPTVSVCDLRDELRCGNKSVFSRNLKAKIEDRLIKSEQVMLFLNRRGYAGFISCRSCGEVIKCPHCDVSLSKHMNGKLVCHYCGYEQEDIKECPNCHSKMIGSMRAGTEQIEEMIRREFPFAKVLRMDADTTRKKGGYEEILSAFASREADILIGTQMIVKGHDFPYVTLVGILAADMSLNAGDYRAAERTYQLLVQAAGRAGRAHIPGEVVIQTYQPDHYAIVDAVAQDYDSFYEEEMAYRSMVAYPPAGHMLAILIESDSVEEAHRFADMLAEQVENDIIKCCDKTRVFKIGPAEATIKKISDIYRYVIYLKCMDAGLLIKCKDVCEEMMSAWERRNVHVTFDLNPMSGY